jgi:inorganic pyrophosphatase
VTIGGDAAATDDRNLSTVRIEVVVEIPKGSRNKYEQDHDTGQVWLDRLLFTAMSYPADYGFIPDTLAGDGDPLDVLVLLDEPTFPGCHIWARPIGVFWMRDEAGPDAKVLCVPDGDPRWDHIHDVDDLRPHMRAEIHHFFEAYKELEPGKSTEVRGWEGLDSAVSAIEDARARFAAAH